jgi:DNA topoisomerase I
VTDGAKNGRIPKDVAPETLTEADCVAILAAAPAKGKGRFGRKGKVEAPKKTRTVKAKAETAEKAPAQKAPAKKKVATKKATTAKKKAPAKKAAATGKTATRKPELKTA